MDFAEEYEISRRKRINEMKQEIYEHYRKYHIKPEDTLIYLLDDQELINFYFCFFKLIK